MRSNFVRNALRDDRRFLDRLWPALLVGAAIAMTWVLFGPLNLIVRNSASLPFSYRDILLPCVLGSLLCTAAAGLGLGLLRGKVYDLFLSLAAGFLLASYLQGTYLNLNLGTLNGAAVRWEHHAAHALLNTAVWCVLVPLPRLLYAWSKRVWKGFVVFLPVLLIGMQGVALVETLTAPSPAIVRRDEYLSTAGIYEVSSKDNILVFLLDQLDTVFIDEVMTKSPGFFDALDGFTYYSNNLSMYDTTFPAVCYLLTGAPHRFERPTTEYYREAWGDSRFIAALRGAGYTTKVYSAEGYVFNDIWQLRDRADNISPGMIAPKKWEVLKHTAMLTAYRYVPHALKASFWLSTSDFEKLARVDSGPQPYTLDDPAFYQGLAEAGLSVQDEKNNFAFYHLNGCHPPINLTEDIRTVETSTTLGQTKGCFNIVYAYLDRLKALGLYEDATIIITGDHCVFDDTAAFDRGKFTALFVKPSGSAGAPLAASNAPQSAAYFFPTILDAAGIDARPFGDTYFDIPEDSAKPRTIFYRRLILEKGTMLVEYEVGSDAKNPANWREVDQYPIRYKR